MYVGFFVTARMVRALIQEQRPDWASDAILCKARLWQILFFSLKLFVIFVFAAILTSALFNLSVFAFVRNYFSFRVVSMAAFFIACIFLAWIFVPSSLKIIADRPSGSIPPATKNSRSHCGHHRRVGFDRPQLLHFNRHPVDQFQIRSRFLVAKSGDLAGLFNSGQPSPRTLVGLTWRACF